jgi:hypothetical protein
VSGMDEARREVEALPTSATVWTGEPLVYRAAVLEILARLASTTPDSAAVPAARFTDGDGE